MKHPLPLTALAAICSLLVGLAFPANAQVDTATSAEDAALEAAVLARRSSAEFKQQIEVADAARKAEMAAIASIPQTQAIEEELLRLQERMRELQRLRQEILQYYAKALEPYRAARERANQDLLAADPVLTLLDRRMAQSTDEDNEAQE